MARTLDMTKGKPLGLLTAFAVPLLFGNICQVLYSVADSTVVGRILGVEAFAAVGAAGFYSWLVLDIVLGLSQGLEVLLGQQFGKKDELGLHRAVAMSVLLTGVLSILLAVCAQAAVEPVLSAAGTPEDIRAQTALYLRWWLAGVPAMGAYNLCASLLRAMGNSRVPLISVIVSSVSNVALNLLFAAVFHWGVAGVAAATVCAQIFSFLACLWALRKIPEVRLRKEDFRLHGPTMRELLRLGLPPALRNGVICLGGFFVQKEINRYGTLFVAGLSASERYLSLMTLIGGALEGAIATFTAQNYGAGKMDRVRSGMAAARNMGLISSAATALMVIAVRRPLIALLVSGTPEELAVIVDCGSRGLTLMALFLPALYLLCIHRAAIQGMGNALFPTLSGFIELAARLAVVTVLPIWIGRWGIYLATPLAWVCAFVLLAVAYHRVCRSREKAIT